MVAPLTAFNMVFEGDSITEGSDDLPKGFPYYVSQLLLAEISGGTLPGTVAPTYIGSVGGGQSPVVNRNGVSGSTVQTHIDHADAEGDWYGPGNPYNCQVNALCIGVNTVISDAGLTNFPVQLTALGLDLFYRHQLAGIDLRLVLLYLPECTEASRVARIPVANAEIPGIAANLQAHGMKVFLAVPFGLTPGDFAPDGVHPTAAAHQNIMAPIVWTAMKTAMGY